VYCAPSDGVLWCTCKQWVWGSAFFAPYSKGLQTLACLMVTVYPLPACSGRIRGIPRALRCCKLCEGVEVEDLLHFLLRCSRYSVVRAQFDDLFDGVVHSWLFMADFLNVPDQAAVAHAVVSMLQFRMVALKT